MYVVIFVPTFTLSYYDAIDHCFHLASSFSFPILFLCRNSQAVNAYYGCYLYALATANTEMQQYSLTLMTMEIGAVQAYWHMGSVDIYDTLFANSRMVGNLGALDVTASTWFGHNAEFVHGINM